MVTDDKVDAKMEAEVDFKMVVGDPEEEDIKVKAKEDVKGEVEVLVVQEVDVKVISVLPLASKAEITCKWLEIPVV